MQMTMLLRCSLNGEVMPASECYLAAGLEPSTWNFQDADQCSRRFLLGVALAFMFNDPELDDDIWLEAI